MENVYKVLNNVNTNLIIWGNPFDCAGQDVVVCITGNPGIPDFYIEFAEEIHKQINIPVCIIGHAGHSKNQENDNLNNHEEYYNLQGQLQHKVELFNKLIDKKSKLHLIGHSIGAWFVLELFQKCPELLSRVSSVNLLFPTIHKMAESPNGINFNKFLRRLKNLILILLTLLSLLPKFIMTFIINIYLRLTSLPENYSERIMIFLNKDIIQKVIFLACYEMDYVVDINHDALKKIKHMTNIVYSIRDGWAPVDYMDDLKQYEPQLQMKKVDISHSFVLKSSERVASMVVENIKTKL